MIRNLFFKALQVCFIVFLFCGLTGCGVELFVDNQTQDNLNITPTGHVMQGKTEILGAILPGNSREFTISRSYGQLATLTVYCPSELDTNMIRQDTIVIGEPQWNVLTASAKELTVSITNVFVPTGEYGDMPIEELLEDAEDEPAEDLRGES